MISMYYNLPVKEMMHMDVQQLPSSTGPKHYSASLLMLQVTVQYSSSTANFSCECLSCDRHACVCN